MIDHEVSSASGDIAPATAGSAASPATPAPQTASDSGATPTSAPDPSTGSLTTDATTGDPMPPGWAPGAYKRFQDTNRKAQELQEKWTRTEQAFGDVLQMDPQHLRGMLGWYRQAGADPVQFATELLNNLVTNEKFRPQVASQAARILGSLKQVTPREEPEPQPDLVAENGEPVFSAKQLRHWREWDSRRSKAEMEARLTEALKPLQEIKQEREVARVNQQVQTAAAGQYKQAQAWHGFKDHEAEIATVFNANPSWDLKDAYLHVLHTKILPTLPAQAQAQVVADLQQKAAAQSLNPTGTTKPSTPDFKGDFKKALEWHAGKR